MPIKYAIRSNKDDSTPTTEVSSQEHHAWNDGYASYEDVPAGVAEMAGKDGRCAIFSELGSRLSDWNPLYKDEKVAKAWAAGAKDSGPAHRDCMEQIIQPGDYLFSHGFEFRTLDLGVAIRSTKTKVVTEDLTGWSFSKTEVRNRNPEALLRIPAELIDGGTPRDIEFETMYAIQYETRDENRVTYEYEQVNEATAKASPNGHFGYFERSNANSVTGWVSMEMNQREKETLANTRFGNKHIVQELEELHKDALGSELNLGDWVFTGDNHYSTFIIAKVIGFTDHKVRLHGYQKGYEVNGYRKITMNWPLNVVKIPVIIHR